MDIANDVKLVDAFRVALDVKAAPKWYRVAS